GRLVIGNTPGGIDGTSRMWVHVITPSLGALRLSGSGIVIASGVQAAQLTVTRAGSGVVRANGTADRLDVLLSGSGDAQLRGVGARDVHAVVQGSGRIVV